MNAPYLILGLLFGLAVGYGFGWQYQRKTNALRFPISRMNGWSDARYIDELENVIRKMRGDSAKLAQVSRLVADCAGGMPCKGCTERRRCAAMGCVRMAEPCEPPQGIEKHYGIGPEQEGA